MIREYQPQDLPVLYDIYRYYVNTTPYNFDLEPMSYGSYERQINEIANQYPFFVACHEDRVIGYAYVHPAFSKKAYRYCMEVTIYFKEGPHYQMADPLLETLEMACREKGYRWLISCITDSNQASIDFHARHDYILMGSLPECGQKNDQWHGVVWMNKDLMKKAVPYYQAHSSMITGDVKIDQDSSVWFGAVIRGDSAPVTIGKETNIQDNAVLHGSIGHPLTISDRVTIGHGAIVHGCTINEEVLIGMGAIIMDDACIERHCIIGAGTIIPSGKVIPEGSVVIGNPGKIVHSICPEQIQAILDNAQEYVDLAKDYRKKRT